MLVSTVATSLEDEFGVEVLAVSTHALGDALSDVELPASLEKRI